jgi:hypothetical protein
LSPSTKYSPIAAARALVQQLLQLLDDLALKNVGFLLAQVFATLQ